MENSNESATPAPRKRNGKGMHRRRFLGGLVGAGAALAATTTAVSLIALTDDKNKASATSVALTIPDLLTATTTDGVDVYTLDMQTRTHEATTTGRSPGRRRRTTSRVGA